MERKIGTAPTLESGTACKRVLEYPESDGEPMAETGRHVRALLDMIDMVDWHFRGVPDVHVSGNMFLYYEEGNPRKVISPDVFMVRGVSKQALRTYKTWEQQPHLDFVVELASPSTFMNDLNAKKTIYEQVLRVKEYYIYDPYHEIDPSFVGFRLVGDTYREIDFVEGFLPSDVLGLWLGEREGFLRLYDPVNGVWIGPSRERVDEAEVRVDEAEARVDEAEARVDEAEARVDEAEARVDEAEARAAQESHARQQAEAELTKLRAALEHLQTS